jgi:hypothetical protein
MRRGLMLVFGLLTWAMALMAVPAPVQARDLPGALLGVITRPLGAILGAPRYGRRSHRHRRSAASRSRAPAAAETQQAAVAAGAAAVTGTAAVAATAAGTSQAEAKTPADVVAQPEKDATPAATAAVANVPLPVAAPARAATVSEPKEPPKAAEKPDAKPVASTEAKPAAQAPEAKPAAPATEVKAAETKPAEVKAAEVKPAVEAKSVEAKPVEAKPAAEATPEPAAAPAPAQRTAAVSRPAEPAPPRSTDQPPARQQPTAAPAARGGLRSGMTGPLTWPTALEDVVGFTLWAGEYSERLRGHGIGDVLSAVMVPASALAARIRPGVTNLARADARAAAAGGSPGGSLGVCSMEPASEDWLTTQIERSMELKAEQRAALAQLKTAFVEAAVRIRAACRDEAAPSSAERLRTMQTVLWAVHDAAIQLRAPLAKFYDTLSADQRQKFAAPAAAQADPRSMAPQAIARLCGAPQSGDAMIRQAEQSLNLNRAQRLSLDAFQKKSAEMGQFLMASCLKPVAATPVERLDAAADRLTALIFAASTVNLALNDFYNQLSDEQRTKFDAAVR